MNNGSVKNKEKFELNLAQAISFAISMAAISMNIMLNINDYQIRTFLSLFSFGYHKSVLIISLTTGLATFLLIPKEKKNKDDR
ncbi:hypothetical protein QTV49_004882 [Vibrio vulnificus]|nr:hypothetical protein [Vibrio vulnificus]